MDCRPIRRTSHFLFKQLHFGWTGSIRGPDLCGGLLKRDGTKTLSDRLSFDEVLEEELRCIELLRVRRGVRAKAADDEEETADQARRAATDHGAGPPSVEDGENEAAGESSGDGGAETPDYDKIYTATAKAHYQQLVGLAFSGGGIRSATFNLGILQALAQAKLLRHFDYLSTVSGGGYIGAWLVAWIKRNSDAAAEVKKSATDKDVAGEVKSPPEDPAVRVSLVEQELAQEHCENPSKTATPKRRGRDDEITPITFLRKYSNYLTPQTGFFSLDTWMAVATYVRNLLLNLNVLVFAVAVALLLPRLFVAAVLYFSNAGDSWWNRPDLLLAVIAMLSLLIAWAVATRFGDDQDRAVLTEQGVFLTVVLPVFLVGTLFVCWLISGSQIKALLIGPDNGYQRWLFGGGLALLSFWIAFAAFLSISRGRKGLEDLGFGPNVKTAAHLAGAFAPLAAFLGGAVGGGLLWLLMRDDVTGGLQPVEIMRISIWAPPAAAFVLTLSGVYFIGLMGRDLPEEERQWWSRSGAFVAILATVWAALFMITFYAPVTLRWAASESQALVASLGIGWLLSTIFGVVAGRSTSTHGADSRPWLEIVVQLAPYVFVVGLLMLLSLGIDALLPVLAGEAVAFAPAVVIDPDISAFERLAMDREAHFEWTAGWLGKQLGWLVVVCLVTGIATLLLSWRFDINEFSMHNFYRDRLTRAYLGASRDRDPNPFTGFDPEDDLDLTTLLDCSGCERHEGRKDEIHGDGYDGPYPIVNAALNLTAGKSELAWQERKASSFVFTPRHHGYDSGRLDTCIGPTGAYRRSADIAEGNDPQKLSLGTAITVSGAAANPNMGYHSAPALAFLLTVFNARLGLWMGNPGHPVHCDKKSPTFSIVPLISELFGRADADSKWVNLSDGGFFDNLGVYELVRRRCRFILACDGEGDPELRFDGLGNVIRRCRSDFGIEIRFENLDPLKRRDDTPFSHWHCAVGSIRYDLVDERAPQGVLVYVKSTLTGDEPADVLNYQRKHKEFPHQSTADQWFDESQFESYRRLGEHIGRVVFGAVGLGPRG